jgi:hypothetical protein
MVDNGVVIAFSLSAFIAAVMMHHRMEYAFFSMWRLASP